MAERASFWHSGIPDCVNAMVSWIEGVDRRPLPGLHGTGFFVRRQRSVAFLTCRHCLGAPDADYHEVLRQLAIPRHGVNRPVGRSIRDWVKFDTYAIPRVNWNHEAFFNDGDLDLAVLKVSAADDRITRSLLARSAKLPPTGEWLEQVYVANGEGEIAGLVAVGFPRCCAGTSINYETGDVELGRVKIGGRVTGRGDYPHTWRIEFDNAQTQPWDLDGMSGAPVFLHWKRPEGPTFALAGMMIRGTFPVGQFMDVSWYVAALNQLLES